MIASDFFLACQRSTAKIEGGFVLFPKKEHWLDHYLRELVTFPNAPNDDQVDSTVYALAWITDQPGEPGILGFYRNEVAEIRGTIEKKDKMVRAWVSPGSSHLSLIFGRTVSIPNDRIIEVTEEEIVSILQSGGKRLD